MILFRSFSKIPKFLDLDTVSRPFSVVLFRGPVLLPPPPPSLMYGGGGDGNVQISGWLHTIKSTPAPPPPPQPLRQCTILRPPLLQCTQVVFVHLRGAPPPTSLSNMMTCWTQANIYPRPPHNVQGSQLWGLVRFGVLLSFLGDPCKTTKKGTTRAGVRRVPEADLVSDLPQPLSMGSTMLEASLFGRHT